MISAICWRGFSNGDIAFRNGLAKTVKLFLDFSSLPLNPDLNALAFQNVIFILLKRAPFD